MLRYPAVFLTWLGYMLVGLLISVAQLPALQVQFALTTAGARLATCGLIVGGVGVLGVLLGLFSVWLDEVAPGVW